MFAEVGIIPDGPACNNGLDDDGDGFADAADERVRQLDNDEGDSCADSIDNDGDGWIDIDDPDCTGIGDEQGFGSQLCNDGIDNDGDGYTIHGLCLFYRTSNNRTGRL